MDLINDSATVSNKITEPSKRKALLGISLGAFAWLSLFLKACQDRARFVESMEGGGGRDSKNKNESAATSQNNRNSGASPKAPLDTECPAVTTTQIKIDGFTSISAETSPILKFYGNPASTSMLALQVRDRSTTHLFLLKEDGKMIAIHAVGPSDLRADGSFRPIVLDGLFLASMKELLIVSSTNDGFLLSRHAIEYFNRYKNIPVANLDTDSYPAKFAINQSIMRFKNEGGFRQSSIWFYPNLVASSAQRPLFTAQSDAKWTITQSRPGELVDLMGEPITKLDVTEHQSFCSYVLGSDGMYYRTMLKVG